MNIPLPKLKALLKYICDNTNHNFLGVTKLMKLLYFIDFTHIKKYGVSITNDTYCRLERGPVPTRIKNLIDGISVDPEWSALSDLISIEKREDRIMHKVKCNEHFTEDDRDYFSPLEMNTIEIVCKRFANANTKTIVDASHNEAAWKKTPEFGEIDYTLAADDVDCIVSKEDIKLLEKIF